MIKIHPKYLIFIFKLIILLNERYNLHNTLIKALWYWKKRIPLYKYFSGIINDNCISTLLKLFFYKIYLVSFFKENLQKNSSSAHVKKFTQI